MSVRWFSDFSALLSDTYITHNLNPYQERILNVGNGCFIPHQTKSHSILPPRTPASTPCSTGERRG